MPLLLSDILESKGPEVCSPGSLGL